MSLEFEIAREQAQEQLDELSDRLARLQQEREERGPAPDWTPQPAPAPPMQRRAVEPREQPAQHTGVDWPKVSTWICSHIDQRVGVKTRDFVTEVTVALGEEAGKLIAELRVQVDRQAARIEQLEARLFELALRQGAAPPAPAADAPAKPVPRLIGVSDAAD